MPLRNSVLFVVKAALLVIGAGNLLVMLAQTPIGSESLRVDGPYGDWRVEYSDFLFERGSYLREQAFQFLEEVAVDGDSSAAVAARDVARASLVSAPADPFTWSLLAWSEMLLENDGAALEALKRSWALAPHSPALSQDRLVLAEALGLPASAEGDEAVRAAILRDLDRFRITDPAAVRDIATWAPGVASLVASDTPR